MRRRGRTRVRLGFQAHPEEPGTRHQGRRGQDQLFGDGAGGRVEGSRSGSFRRFCRGGRFQRAGSRNRALARYRSGKSGQGVRVQTLVRGERRRPPERTGGAGDRRQGRQQSQRSTRSPSRTCCGSHARSVRIHRSAPDQGYRRGVCQGSTRSGAEEDREKVPERATNGRTSESRRTRRRSIARRGEVAAEPRSLTAREDLRVPHSSVFWILGEYLRRGLLPRRLFPDFRPDRDWRGVLDQRPVPVADPGRVSRDLNGWNGPFDAPARKEDTARPFRCRRRRHLQRNPSVATSGLRRHRLAPARLDPGSPGRSTRVEQRQLIMDRYDLVILGSGSTAFAAALRAEELGKTAVLTEERTVGGTCVNRGCLPSKNLIEAARLLHDAQNPRYPGLSPTKPEIDFRELVRQKDEVVRSYREKRYESLIGDRIRIERGHARFLDPHTVEVDGRKITGDRILIATGSRPVLPPTEGLADVPYLTSDLLTSDEPLELEELPESLLLVGGGYIALELGQMFRRFGSEVTIVERSGEILSRGYEPEVGPTIRTILEEEGIRVLTYATVRSVRRDGSQVAAVVETKTGAQEFHAARLLVAAGRRPNSDRIALEKAGVSLEGNGDVRVD